MRVFLELPVESRGLQRVYDALVKYAPPAIDITKDPKNADLTIIHVIGRYDKVKAQIDSLRAKNKHYAIIQYCIRSTMHPSTRDWIDMWQGADLVWSYYDLPQLVKDDELYWHRHNTAFNFYYAPLGVDSSVFWQVNPIQGRDFKIICSAQHALSEGVRECAFACKRVGRKMFHIGHELRRGEDIVCKANMKDIDLRYWYSASEYVSGLRRVEGFEQIVLEGMLCGARPIMFDKPHYRAWFDDLAVFIPEGTRDEVIDSLEKVFRNPADPMTLDEKELVKERFNWPRIIGNFYKQLC